MEQEFDVLIIGGGPGGLTAAYALQASGKKVGVVEKDKWGGTCPNRGCDPKKILYHATQVRDQALQLVGNGVPSPAPLMWEELMEFKESFTSGVPTEQKEGLIQAGITVLEGEAVFQDPHRVLVAGNTYVAETVILATGQDSVVLDIPGQEWLETSTDFLQMPHLPKSITFIGGGYISFELANIARGCGSEVHIIHHNDQPLKGFDQEQVASLVKRMQEQGVHFQFNEDVIQVKKRGTGFTLCLSSGAERVTDKVICAVGRKPSIEAMGLRVIGVDYSERGIVVDQYFRTSQPNIFALGDCLDKRQPKLTPVSTFEGSYVAAFIGGQQRQEIRYPLVPTIVFASPQIAQIGKVSLTEEEEQEGRFSSKQLDLSGWFTYRHRNEPLVNAKLVIDQRTGLLVGASVLGSEADQLVNLLTLCIYQRISAEIVAQQISLYPTVASDLAYLY